MTPENKRQRQKNLALLFVLLGLSVLMFALTIVKFGHFTGIANP